MIGALISAWLDVRSKPLRTFAAIAGMAVAIVAVVLVDAATVLSHGANNDYISRHYGRSVTVSVAIGDPAIASRVLPPDALLQRNGFSAVSPNSTLAVFLLENHELRPDSITWVSSQYASIRVVDIVAGAWPAATARSDVGHVVISDVKAAQFGFAIPQLAVGRPLWYAPATASSTSPHPDVRSTVLKPLIVDAVASSDTNAFDENGVLLVSNQPQPAGSAPPQGWIVRISPVDLGLFTELMAATDPATGQPLYSWNRLDQADELEPLLDQQRVTAIAVTIVALTVGGLGILGVGLASVRERSREFGLRRALGASTVRIFGGVLLQSTLEALLASLIAIPVALVLLEVFTRQLILRQLPVPAFVWLPLGSVALGTGAAVAVGLVAGLVPAASAARSSVVQALRS